MKIDTVDIKLWMDSIEINLESICMILNRIEEKMDQKIKSAKKVIDKKMDKLLKQDKKRDKACDSKMMKKKKRWPLVPGHRSFVPRFSVAGRALTGA